jgi:diketogulonate reductase-like aldo/keto reductase
MAPVVPKLVLNNGATLPAIGLGTISFNESHEKIKFAIVTAIRMGYRHIDTASGYHNEELVGEALQEAFRLQLVKREELFVTTKLAPDHMAPTDIIPSLQSSLSKLQLKYIDLYMVHWPLQLKKGAKIPPKEDDFLPLDLRSSWATLEQCVKEGLTKSIGVSNFSVAILRDLLSFAKIPPVVNQVELHPRWQQKRLREFCASAGIIVEAWSPLGAPGQKYGTDDLLMNNVLQGIAAKHQKTSAQVCLRWIIECGCSAVPKSFNRLRMSQNFGIFDWKLDEEDHEMIASIPQNKYFLASFLCNNTTSPFKTVEELWDGDV